MKKLKPGDRARVTGNHTMRQCARNKRKTTHAFDIGTEVIIEGGMSVNRSHFCYAPEFQVDGSDVKGLYQWVKRRHLKLIN